MLREKHEELTELVKNLLEVNGEPVRPEGTTGLDVGDVVIRFKLQAYGPDGQLFEVAGINSLPNLLSQHVLGDAMRRMETSVFDNVVSPFVKKLQQLAKQQITNRNPVGYLPNNDFRKSGGDAASGEDPVGGEPERLA